MGTSSEKPKEKKINKDEDISISTKTQEQEISENSINPKSPELFNKNMLEFHNKYREKHHSTKLENKVELNNKAKEYAEMLLGVKAYNENEGINFFNDNILGENIYYSDKEEKEENICQYWYNENNKYNYDLNNFQKETNHFTQLVWNSTKLIGFGYANYNNKYCYVALYSPAGNFFGEFTNNVFKI